MSETLPKACEIATDLLDRTGVGIMTGDFEAFVDCFWLPHELETFEGLQILADVDAMRAVYDKIRTFHEGLGVTDMVRHVVESNFLDENTISSVHESRLLRGTILIKKPYPVLSTITRMNGEWRIASGQYALNNDAPGLSHALHTGAKELLTPQDGPSSNPA